MGKVAGAAVVFGVLFALGCGGGQGGNFEVVINPPPGNRMSFGQGRADAGAVGVDAGTDGGRDGGTDAGMDGGTDGGMDGGTDGGTNLSTITISDLTFSPQDLSVAPGTVVTVVNLDGFTHSVTSESAPGAFVPGAVNGVSFDTGPFMGTKTFTIPLNAPPGTVIPYYCSVHLSAMRNTGQITIH